MKTMVYLFYYKENLIEIILKRGSFRKNCIRTDIIKMEVKIISGVSFGAIIYKLLWFLLSAQLK